MFVIKRYFLWRTDLGVAFMCFTVYLGQTAHGSEWTVSLKMDLNTRLSHQWV